MNPCMPEQKDSGTCPLTNRTRPGSRPICTLSADELPASCCHIVSGLALAACRRGIVWSRRCRAHVSVGGLLTTMVGRHQFAHRSRGCSSRGRYRAGAEVPAGEVVL